MIIGGVEIPHELGLLGHSDADVLLHAIMDAVLGALGLGDIGKMFPDSDPAYEGISSLALCRAVSERMRAAGYCIGNIDGTVIAQKPKLSKYIPEMQAQIAGAFGCHVTDVNIKATTEEHLGFTGIKTELT